MRSILLALVALAAVSTAHGQTVVAGNRRTVVVQSAGEAAIVLARRGTLVHTGCSQCEGIGFSTVSPEHAKRSCCYWGRRTPTDIGVAWSPIRRGWFAVVRYR